MRLRKMYIILFAILGGVAAVVIAFDPATGVRDETPALAADAQPSRAELVQAFNASRTMALVYGEGDADSGSSYEEYAANWLERVGNWADARIASGAQALNDSSGVAATYVVGTAASNALLAHLASALPVRFDSGGFHFRDKFYADAEDILYLYYPNPRSPGTSLSIITGNSDEHIARFLRSRQFFNMAGDYQIVRDATPAVFGEFERDERGRWVFSDAKHRDFEAERQVASQTPRVHLITHDIALSANEARQITERITHRIAAVADFVGAEAAPPRIDYHIYPSFEDMGLITGKTRYVHFDSTDNAVHVVLDDDLRSDDGAALAMLLGQWLMGRPQCAALELGLGVYFSENWRFKGYAYWAAKLTLSATAPPLSELLDNQALENESDLVMTPFAGMLVEYLLREWGQERFLSEYLRWSPDDKAIAKLESGWQAFLQTRAIPFKEAIASDRAAFARQDVAFCKGFCHAHEGYAIYNGYLSEQSDQALAKLASLGVNAVSITPFTYMRNPETPTYLPFIRGAGSENDESVVHSSLAARTLGMSVMLKPHVWITGSWPGEVGMKSQQEWETFFDHYFRWMRHYALLAEMYRLDILCLGVELSKATMEQPQGWRTLIRRLRGIYSGKMTYAANWGKEFETLEFWDELDFIGLNSYYPLAKTDTPTDADLKRGFAKVIRTIEDVYDRFGKPVFFTEIGFTSTPTPWKQPHEDGRGKALDLESQRRCYDIVFASLRGKPWLHGMYWWKWPSYLDYGGSLSTGFTPSGKPAEKVVAEWFGRQW